MAWIQEFKAFAMRGNVVDMAVGVIIGGAFGKIVNSLVNDLVMPPIGLLMGGVDFTELKLVLSETTNTAGEVETVALAYGSFIQTALDFIILAAAIFVMIQAMNNLRKKEKEDLAPAAPPEPSAEEALLTEIRDLLKAKV